MMMRSLLHLRVLALCSGLAAILHFTFRTNDSASLVWESLFVLANLTQLVILIYHQRASNLTAEESGLVLDTLELTAAIDQRKVLELLVWRDVTPGERLIEQNEYSPDLIYIAGGAASILDDGRLIGVCGPGDFLGEMNEISDKRATASVEAASPMRIAVVDRKALAAIERSAPIVSQAFDRALGRVMARKLLRMNSQIGAAKAVQQAC